METLPGSTGPGGDSEGRVDGPRDHSHLRSRAVAHAMRMCSSVVTTGLPSRLSGGVPEAPVLGEGYRQCNCRAIHTRGGGAGPQLV